MKSSIIALAIALALGFATMHYIGLRSELEHTKLVASYANEQLNEATDRLTACIESAQKMNMLVFEDGHLWPIQEHITNNLSTNQTSCLNISSERLL